MPIQPPTNDSPYFDDDSDDEVTWTAVGDMVVFQRDHPEAYARCMTEIDIIANAYVNYTNSSSEIAARLYDRHENPNGDRVYPLMILERIAATRLVLSSTPTTYSANPFSGYHCCCCPDTGHVENCSPTVIADIEAFQKDHPYEHNQCEEKMKALAMTAARCTTDAQLRDFLSPFWEEKENLRVYCETCGNFTKYSSNDNSHSHDSNADTEVNPHNTVHDHPPAAAE